ncbi:Dual specificity phosphatase Cdc25 [Phytophthora citrophthora]|uniref:Dual specificity phosphatase Cdc25 n=1 Tax=Phytophthora citrophthora TaxID=4793 RepID=A0AAD9FZD1_9STRA|nr:Dual specificity phosphatase Cdc25 [Phytophthora citrophthora]
MPTPEELHGVERISVNDLARVLRSDAESPVIVDVRDEDFELEGHIVNAEHVPSGAFNDDAAVDALVAKFGNKLEIIFHCGHSVTRGPACALRFIERAEAAGVKPHVCILDGGFADFAEVRGLPEEL